MDEARKEIDSLRKELASTQKHSSQVLQLLEEDSDAHPSNRQAQVDRAELIKTRRELSELHATHWITEKELERDKTKALEVKTKALATFREGQYYDEFSDSTHRTRQNQYKADNDVLCSDIEALRKQGLKMQEDLDMTTRNRNELEREIQGLRTTIRKNSNIMETQRVDLGTYKTSLGRLENKYNDVVAELDEANNEIVEREAGIENAGATIFDLRAQVDRLNGELA